MSRPLALRPPRPWHAALVCALALACGEPAQPVGPLPVDPTTLAPHGDPDARPFFHNFGRVAYGERVVHSFLLRNTDPAPVRITQALSSCGCSVAHMQLVDRERQPLPAPEDPVPGSLLLVPPGALFEIALAVDTASLPQKDAPKLVTVRVGTDSPNRPWFTLEASMHVEFGFVLLPTSLELSRVPQGLGAAGEVRVRKNGDQDLVLVGVEDAPPGFDVEVFEDPLFPGEQWRVSVLLPPGLPAGSTVGTIRLSTARADGSPGRALSVPVVSRVIADISVAPTLLILRSRTDQARIEQEARVESLVDGLRFRILSAEVTGAGSEALAVEFTPSEPDSAGRARVWNVHVSAAKEDIQGSLGGVIRLNLDDSQTPHLELRYAAPLR